MSYTSKTKSCDAGKLLSEPSEKPASFTRATCDYEDHSDKFTLKERNFQRQYAQIYYERLVSCRPEVEVAAREKWGEGRFLVGCHGACAVLNLSIDRLIGRRPVHRHTCVCLCVRVTHTHTHTHTVLIDSASVVWGNSLHIPLRHVRGQFSSCVLGLSSAGPTDLNSGTPSVAHISQHS